MNNDNRLTDKFSLGRLGALLKTDFAIRRRAYALHVIIVIGTMCLVGIIISSIVGSGTPGDSYDQGSVGMVMVCGILTFVYLMVTASMAFNDLNSPARRARTLMLPASTLERFAARALPAILIPPVLCAAGYFIGDMVRISITHYIFKADAIYHPMFVFKTLAMLPASVNILVMSCIGVNQICYLLGAVVWPRLSFLKTYALFQVIGAVIAPILMIITATGWYHVPVMDVNDTILTANILLMVMSVVLIVTAYYRYKEIEIVQRW